MKNQIDDVRVFMQACNQNTPDKPIQELELSEARLRVALIAEELGELALGLGLNVEIQMNTFERDDNIHKFDRVEVLDALADLCYVVFGAAVAVGQHDILPEAFSRVNFSNMTKVVHGKCVKDATGKVMKPAGYMPPQLELCFE